MPFATHDSDSTLAVEAGTPFEVRLGAPPTTGYGWEIAHLPSGVELLGGDEPDDQGGPGTADGQVFRLIASQPGLFELRFVLNRRWEQEPIEIRIIEVDAH